MSSVVGFISRVYKIYNPPKATSTTQDTFTRPLRFGILGAAQIAPAALIRPAISHPEVEVYAVAARDRIKAEAFARKHGIPKVHGSYEELVNDPEVDVIYNPLPNMLHFEWTMKALEAGKHVLLEKPAADTVDETKAMFELAEKKGLVLLEAFHYRFHPAVQRMKAILDSGELGKVKHIETVMTTPRAMFPSTDIRFDYGLGGGALMDMGCYTMNAIRYFASSNPTSILNVSHRAFQSPGAPTSNTGKVDEQITASFALPDDVTAELTSDLRSPNVLGVIPRLPQLDATVECEGGKIEMYNFVLPSLYHTITITPRNGRVRKEKVYTFKEGSQKGEPWWETYRYQLEAFVDKTKGREPQAWITKEDTIANMEWIEKVYGECGLDMKYVWLDVDPGHDDATAIMLAVNTPGVQLVGVSTVRSIGFHWQPPDSTRLIIGGKTHGNASSEYTALNAARCLYAFGSKANDVHVFPGADKPLILEAKHDPEIHGEDGLGGVDGLPALDDPLVHKFFEKGLDGGRTRALEGMSKIIRSIWASGTGNKVTVVSSGPMTNIALFVSVYPDLLEAVEEFVFMGGGVGIGNRSAVAEFNILCDPHACQIVLDVPVKKTMIPINVTHTAIVTADLHSRLRGAEKPAQANTPLRHTLSTLISFFAESYKSTFGFDAGPPLHDALTIAYVSNPDMFTTTRYRVDTELSGTHTAGETVVDVWGYKKCDNTWGRNGKNCIVAESLDVPAFFDLLFDAIDRCDKISPLNAVKADR